MLQKHAVSQQDVDNTVGAYTANKAIVDADMASVRHYEALVSFEKVYAPFDGVITTRNTDIGDLIKQNQGSESVAVGRQQVCQAGRVEGSVLAFDTGGDLCNG